MEIQCFYELAIAYGFKQEDFLKFSLVVDKIAVDLKFFTRELLEQLFADRFLDGINKVEVKIMDINKEKIKNNDNTQTEEKIDFDSIIFDTKMWLEVLALRRVESLIKDCFAGISMDTYFKDTLFIMKHTEEICSKLDKITELRLKKWLGENIKKGKAQRLNNGYKQREDKSIAKD